MKWLTGAQYWSSKISSQAIEDQLENSIDQSVLDIIRQVKEAGDRAVNSLTNQFDGIKLDDFTVTKDEFAEARDRVSPAFVPALEQAKTNITRFHQRQLQQSWIDSSIPGIVLGQQVTPLERVGIYIPGGKAAYPSTVLMNVIPAKIAGVESIVITTPPQPNGKVNPHILVAAEKAGADTVYKIGGAQAIAALAYGTETINKVQKITGPGNAYVARAKKWVFGEVAIDMIAGPSEICIVADDTAPADFVAADLLSQAEHDEAATPICIVWNNKQATAIQEEMERQTALLEREEIITKSVQQNGKFILVEDLYEAMDIANDIAPEHLQLMIENPIEKLGYIKNAGAIFLGNYSPEALGDYMAGPNHTLPTNGTAAFSSPLGVYDFMKKSSVIQYNKQSLLNTVDAITELATTEKLTAHAQAIQIRKEDDSNAKA
ncbi:histidinol dehydrogenase [Virgibacillus salexigens]|uniref:histidinol dehydrogenase n=1 Tax=Virgibacillus massiliensis TaxID=1462526 RepID=UPI00136E94E4|nr:histidinol dehydrogenase [Virgibacillus massiliensis]MYL43247.1 histidinol dehydrogenase [Virgibacillus massiliensis]